MPEDLNEKTDTLAWTLYSVDVERISEGVNFMLGI